MASNSGETPSDDFLEQILGFPSYGGGEDSAGMMSSAPAAMMFQNMGSVGIGGGAYGGVGHGGGGFPLGLTLETGKGGFTKVEDCLGSGSRFGEDVVYPRRPSSSVEVGYHGQQMMNTVPVTPQQTAIRPKPRARRGQATDPHSIAERLRREKIAERVRALQELVPTVNKTDRAAMLDEIVDYVKFLRLQVKVLSTSRLGGAAAVAPLVTEMPVSSIEEEGVDNLISQPVWEKWSNDGTERQVVKLMEENVGAAMQFLQSKDLCIMPISLASVICHTHSPESASLLEPESNPP